MSTIVVAAQFTRNAGQPATGLTLSEIDLYLTRIHNTTGVDSVVWSGAEHPTQEIDNCGVYARLYTLADLDTYSYFVMAHYTGVTVLDVNYVIGSEGRVESLPTTVAISAIADGVWDEVLTGATHNVPTSAGRRLRSIADIVIYEGVTVSSTNNTIVLDAGASATNGAYDPAMIYMVSGASIGQTRLILQYDGATRRAIVDRDWKANPQAGDEFVIAGDPGREHVNEGVAQSGGADWIQLNLLASDNDDAYNGQVVFIRSGTGQDQARRIVDYDGATHTAYVDRAWDVQPDNTSAGAILPTGLLTYQYIADAVWDELIAGHSIAGSTGAALAAMLLCGCGAGATHVVYTLTDSGTGLPISDADIWVTTDVAGANVVAAGQTDALGRVNFWLDSGVTYYVWRQKDGYTLTNPDTEVVP